MKAEGSEEENQQERSEKRFGKREKQVKGLETAKQTPDIEK